MRAKDRTYELSKVLQPSYEACIVSSLLPHSKVGELTLSRLMIFVNCPRFMNHHQSKSNSSITGYLDQPLFFRKMVVESILPDRLVRLVAEKRSNARPQQHP